MGRITIYLTGKQGTPQTDDYKVDYSSVPYNDKYMKLTISIQYFKSSTTFALEFRQRFKNFDGHPTVVFYTYYNSHDNQALQKIEVYTSKFHPKNPLVVGFQLKGDQSFKYFTYFEIKKYSSTYGVPSSGQFGENKLLENIQDANKHRNKLIFNNNPKQRENYGEETDSRSFAPYARYRCFAKDDNRHVTRKMSRDKLFDKEKLSDFTTIDKLLEELVGNPFDSTSIYYSTDPIVILLVEFINDSTKTHFVRLDEKGVYWVKEQVNYTRDGELVSELHKIKSSLDNLLFMLDKNDDDVIFKGKIKFSRQKLSSYKFTKYIHEPSTIKKAKVIYKDIPFTVVANHEIRDNKFEVQDKSYKKIETYSLDRDASLHLLIKFTVSDPGVEYYFQRTNVEGTEWKQITDNGHLNINTNLRDKLLEIDYKFKKSLVIKINEKKQYSSGTVKNSSSSLSPDNLFTVNPTSYYKCGTFTCYNHDLTRYKSIHNIDVVGIRLKCNDNEIKLYNGDVDEKNRQYIYYDKHQKDFYVYFYGSDNRPLMLCYKNKAYRATSKQNYNQFKFSVTTNIETCLFQKNYQNFTSNLNEIYDQLNEVDIYKNSEYVVHNYNNENVKINVSHITSGCYIKYLHTSPSGNRLGTINYNTKHIKDSTDSTSITASGNKIVVVYYSSSDSSLKKPLLVALCTSDISNNSSLYYELENNDSESKTYKKISKYIRLDTNPNGTLYTTLDRLFYNYAKSLSITLNKPIGNYQTKLTSTKSPEQHINTTINVNQVKCPQLDHSGYKCYLHNIISIADIGEVGGLKLYLYDYKELSSNSHSGVLQKIEDIKYNSCKGNVFVFFYDSDPRPLSLFFDSKWYVPKDKENYVKQWEIVPGIIDFDYLNPDSDATKILMILYGVSMFLNPVYINETMNAYKKRETEDSHTYTIHDYSPQNIKIRITSKNLICYKQYSHEPENGSDSGYRLGEIHFEKSTNQILSYSKEKPLKQVSLYYSVYDTEHKHPLLVKLNFRGSSSTDCEYYRLVEKNALKWDKLITGKHKGLLEKLSKEDNVESGLYDIRTGLNITYHEEEKKKNFFFNPEQCTEDNVGLATYVGAPLGTLAGVGTVATIGFVLFKKLGSAAITTAVAAAAAA